MLPMLYAPQRVLSFASDFVPRYPAAEREPGKTRNRRGSFWSRAADEARISRSSARPA